MTNYTTDYPYGYDVKPWHPTYPDYTNTGFAIASATSAPTPKIDWARRIDVTVNGKVYPARFMGRRATSGSHPNGVYVMMGTGNEDVYFYDDNGNGGYGKVTNPAVKKKNWTVTFLDRGVLHSKNYLVDPYYKAGQLTSLGKVVHVSLFEVEIS